MPDEEIVWEGRPSQWVNFTTFLGCGLLCWLVIPIFVALAAYLKTKFTTYKLTSHRLFTSSGVFSRRTDELELFRVKDTVVLEPFFLRLVGLGVVIINTVDVSSPQVSLVAVTRPNEVRDILRKSVEARRQQRKVGMVEVA